MHSEERSALFPIPRRDVLKSIAALGVVGWGGFRGSAACATSLRIGAPAPAATLVTLDGRRIATSDLLGQVVILAFWANVVRALSRGTADPVGLRRGTRLAGSHSAGVQPGRAGRLARGPESCGVILLPRRPARELERGGIRQDLGTCPRTSRLTGRAASRTTPGRTSSRTGRGNG